MGDTAKICPHITATCAHNAIFSLLIIHIILSRQIYVAIDNPSLVPSVSYHTSSSHFGIDVHAADNGSDAENLPSNICRSFSHLY